MSDTSASINKVLINEVSGEDLEAISEATRKGLGNEEAGVGMDTVGHGSNAHDGVIGLGSDSVLDPIKVVA